MFKGVYLEAESLGSDLREAIPLQQLPVSWQSYSFSSDDQVSERITDAHIVVTNKAAVGAEQMDAAPNLKLIAICATGTNVIDLAAARERGITVCNCTGYGTPSVAQHTFSLILALTTRLLDYHRDVMAGRWGESEQFCRMDYPVMELAGKTIGIIGYGELGQAVGKLAQAFGMNVVAAQLSTRATGSSGTPRLPLNELLATADVVSIHCPLTDDTRNLISDAELAQMKETALLINTARGGIVDEQALANALKSGEIAGAGVDVLTSEPPSDGNVLIDTNLPNLLITPHSAWIARESRERLLQQTADNIAAFLAGKPCNRVA